MSLCRQPYTIIKAKSHGKIIGYKIIMENIQQGQVVDVNEGYSILAPRRPNEPDELLCLGYCSNAYDRYHWLTTSEVNERLRGELK